jgi:hypothetical protein
VELRVRIPLEIIEDYRNNFDLFLFYLFFAESSQGEDIEEQEKLE